MGAPAHLAGRQCSSLLYSCTSALQHFCTTALLYMIPSSIYNSPRAGVAELVDAGDSKSPAFTGARVRIPPPAPFDAKCLLRSSRLYFLLMAGHFDPSTKLRVVSLSNHRLPPSHEASAGQAFTFTGIPITDYRSPITRSSLSCKSCLKIQWLLTRGLWLDSEKPVVLLATSLH